MARIEFDKMYSDLMPNHKAKPGRPTKKVKATEFRRVMGHPMMFDVYDDGICTRHIWRNKKGNRWFEIPAGDSGSPREVKAPPDWVLK